MRSASDGPSALSQDRLRGALGTDRKKSDPSGRACRQRCNYQRSFRLQRVAKCVELARVASPSSRPSLSFVDKSGVQYAALPYRFNEVDGLEILLVTTRRTKRWIIPKGWASKGVKPPESAAREAYEEAGVRGKIGKKSVGVFTYKKLLDEEGITVPCEVKVFPLLVKRQSKLYPEIEQRLTRWLEPERAISLVKEMELKALLLAFVARFGGSRHNTSS